MSTSDTTPATYQPTTNPVLWGAYLACSWTWCIGMFLPALLLRDFGWPGFLIFAVPNCVGAAAMGWVLKSPDSSRRFVERHPMWVRAFSLVTIGFHVYWIAWIIPVLKQAFPIPDEYLFAAGAVVVTFTFVSGRAIRAGRAPQLAAFLLLMSLGVLAAFLVTGAGDDARQVLTETPTAPGTPIGLIPMSCLGFLLCPYLDATFHHARQNASSPNGGKVAFTLGFMVFFAAMIVLTTRYGGVLALTLEGKAAPPIPQPWLCAALLTHILCQWVFTVRVHMNRMRPEGPMQIEDLQLLYGTALVAGLLGYFSPKLPGAASMNAGELGYRGFLWFYGLVFPCAVLYFAVRRRAGAVPLQRWMMVAAIIVATPMFWLGFVENRTLWLIPGVLVAISGAFVLRAKDGAGRLADQV